MPIDYSKWDHLDDSDDDGEQTSTPRVTQLDAPSRVTFGGNSSGTSPAVIEPQSQVAAATTARDPSVPGIASHNLPSKDKLSLDSKSKIQAWTSKGSTIKTKDNRLLYWCQDRYTVQIRLELGPNEFINRVQVEGILPFAERHCATGTHKHQLVITGTVGKASSTSKVLLEGDLPHPVHWSQDDDSDAEGLDWTFERLTRDGKKKFVFITLCKAVPMQGLFVWWKRPLVQFDEIALDDSDKDRSATSKEFLEAWDEAHRLFREKKRPAHQTLS